MPEGAGCIVASLAFIAVVVTGLVSSSALSARRAAEERQRAAEERQRIQTLVSELASDPRRVLIAAELAELLQTPGRLTATAAFMDDVYMYLRVLLFHRPTATLVTWFFARVTVPVDDRLPLVRWLGALFSEAAAAHPEALGHLCTILGYVSTSLTPSDVGWLYQLALAAVQTSAGHPESKALALHLGRMSYSFVRPGRNPTIYDEQAIANDIAVRCPSVR